MEGGNGVSRPEDERVQWSRLQACLEGRNAVSRPEDEREGGDHSLRVTETDTNQQLLTYSTYSYRTIAKKHPCQSGGCSERAHSMDPGGVSLGRPPAGKHTRHTLKARAGGELGAVGVTPWTQGTLLLGLSFPPGWKQMKGCCWWAGLPRIPPWKASTASGSRGPLPVSPCAILLPAPLHTEAGLTTMPRDLWQ